MPYEVRTLLIVYCGYNLLNPCPVQIIKNNDLEELQELGSGTFGTVYNGK